MNAFGPCPEPTAVAVLTDQRKLARIPAGMLAGNVLADTAQYHRAVRRRNALNQAAGYRMWGAK